MHFAKFASNILSKHNSLYQPNSVPNSYFLSSLITKNIYKYMGKFLCPLPVVFVYETGKKYVCLKPINL